MIEDNCCQSRSILQEVFGDDVPIKLDLWHSQNRVQKSMLNKNMAKADRFAFNRQLSHCFRHTNNKGRYRNETTLDEAQIIQNLNTLLTNWSENISPKTKKEIITLRDKHSVCLADIPKGMDTNR